MARPAADKSVLCSGIVARLRGTSRFRLTRKRGISQPLLRAGGHEPREGSRWPAGGGSIIREGLEGVSPDAQELPAFSNSSLLQAAALKQDVTSWMMGEICSTCRLHCWTCRGVLQLAFARDRCTEDDAISISEYHLRRNQAAHESLASRLLERHARNTSVDGGMYPSKAPVSVLRTRTLGNLAAARTSRFGDDSSLTRGRLTRTFEGWMGIEIATSRCQSHSAGGRCHRTPSPADTHDCNDRP